MRMRMWPFSPRSRKYLFPAGAGSRNCSHQSFPGFVPRNILMSDDVLTYLTTEVFDRVHLVGEEEEVLPGIRMFWVGVHHRSSMAISIPTNKGRVVISDCFFKYKNIEDNIILGVTESVEECKRSYARIRREALT